MKLKPRYFKTFIVVFLCAVLAYQVYRIVTQYYYQNAILKQIVSRLEADSRAAEVLVTGVNFNETDQKTYTTIKFLEYNSHNRPLEPKYFTFSGNIIQFQSLVVRFEDIHIRKNDHLRGKSVYLFWKVFMLDGPDTQEYDITEVNEVPKGYKLDGPYNPVEAEFWLNFWDYALDPQKAHTKGVKNAQIEAPGTMFVPGNVYTIRIEHDGGLRIDSAPVPAILLGEKIPLKSPR